MQTFVELTQIAMCNSQSSSYSEVSTVYPHADDVMLFNNRLQQKA